MLPDAGDVTLQTLELLWRAAPEQVAELDDIFAAGIQARLLKDAPAEIGVLYNVLQIPEDVLRQLWLLYHAAWSDFEAFDCLKKNPDCAAESSLTAKAVEAATQILKRAEPNWPSEIPNFGEIKDGVTAKAIRELYAVAVAWTIAHEMRHAKFDEDAKRPENPVDEETTCDAYAADLLFSKADEYSKLTGELVERVRGKRAMGALVGLYYVARLSKESQTERKHPPVQDRIKLLFDKVSTEPAQHFWTFATGLLWGLNPIIANMPVEKHNPTSRELAYIALDFAFSKRR